MFAPLVAKPKSTPPKPAEAIDPSRRSRRSTGDQATSRFVAPQASRIPDASGAQTTGSATGQEAALSWDFSKIPVHPPGSAGRLQTPRFFAGARLPIQAKLKVGAIDDPLEHEADRVADHVMRMPAPASGLSSAPPQVSRKCAACEEEDKLQKKEAASSPPALTEAPPSVFEQEADRVADAVMRMATPAAADEGPAIQSAGPRIQRKCAACGADGDEPCTCVQREAESSPPAPLAAISDHAPSVLRTGGQPLSSRDRRFFEPRFGADFSRVRIHSDAAAAEMAQALHARAFTVGGHIVFGAGLFTPETQDGRRLLAHELTHVVQQEHRPHAVQRQAEPATDPRIVVTPTKEGVNITITADTKLEGSEVFVLTVMYGKRVSRERAIKLIKSGEDVGCVAPVCKTGMQPGETIDLFFGPDQRRQQEHVQAPKRKLPPEVQNALESGYMRIFMLDRQTQKHLELPAQPDFSEDRAVIMARNTLLMFSHNDIGCFWRWLAGEKIEGWWNLAYRLGQFLEVRPNVCAPVDLTPLGRLSGHEDTYALIKETEKLEQQTYTQAGRYDQELHEKLDAARAERDKALRNADFPDVGAFDTAANEFRVYFRTVAVAVLEHSLDQTEHVLRDAVGRYQVGSNPNIKPGNQINPVAQQLYDELYRLPNSQARSRDQLLIDHPILQGVTVWDTINRAENVLDFSNRLTRYALERLNIDLHMVRNALGRSQDVVFKFGPIVEAAMERVGVAPGSIFASVIQDQRGKPGEPWWQKVLDVGLLLLSFVPGPIGFAARTVSAIRDIGSAGNEYSEQYSAYEVGYQDKPSVAPIAISVGANVVPDVAVAGAGKVFRAVKALRAASSLETAAARTAAMDIVKTKAGDVARKEGNVLATDLARTEGEAAKDIAKAEGEAVKDVGKTEGEAAKDVAKTEGEAAKDVAKEEGEAAKDIDVEPPGARETEPGGGGIHGEVPTDMRGEVRSGGVIEIRGSNLEGLRQQAVALVDREREVLGKIDKLSGKRADLIERLEGLESNPRVSPSAKGITDIKAEIAEIDAQLVEHQGVRQRIEAESGAVNYEIERLEPPAPARVAEPDDPLRPKWQESEKHAHRELGPDWKDQESYKGGKKATRGEKGTSRPDLVDEHANVWMSVDVKNYNIETNRRGLVNDVVNQARDRAAHLPKGMRQAVMVDIRGQVVTTAVEQSIEAEIVKKSGGLIHPDNIVFLRD